MNGIHEHVERVGFFFDLARTVPDPKSRYRLMLAAIYSCRAATELMLEAAEKQEIRSLVNPDAKVRRDDLEERLRPQIPFYDLIERIRIHDFHRFGLEPPDENTSHVMLGGPVKVLGGASVAVTDAGLEVSLPTKAAAVKFNRPLLSHDGDFFDEGSKRYVTLDEILSAFLAASPTFLLEVERLFRVEG
jgi:hypothetical protein